MGLNGVSRMDRVRGDRANPQSVSLRRDFRSWSDSTATEEVQAYTHGRSGDRAKDREEKEKEKQKRLKRA
jgi:hypothetical protein